MNTVRIFEKIKIKLENSLDLCYCCSMRLCRYKFYVFLKVFHSCFLDTQKIIYLMWFWWLLFLLFLCFYLSSRGVCLFSFPIVVILYKFWNWKYRESKTTEKLKETKTKSVQSNSLFVKVILNYIHHAQYTLKWRRTKYVCIRY